MIDASPLTRREYEILVLSADGDSKRQVGEVLGIAEDTVRSYTKTLFLKLDARNMAHAVAIGYQRGILGG